MTPDPTANDNHTLTPYDEFVHVTRIIRGLKDYDRRAQALLIWMIGQTDNFSHSVAITIYPTSLVYKMAEQCTGAVHKMYEQFGTGRLSRGSLRFSARAGCGYRRGALGIPIYHQEGNGGGEKSRVYPHTIWLSRHPFGRLPSLLPSLPDEQERLRLLDTSAWIASMSEGQLLASGLF